MRNLFRRGSDRASAQSDDMADRRHRGHRHHHHHADRSERDRSERGERSERRDRSERRRGGRPFEYGELRLLALAMIADEPRYGYELMKAIEERTGGSYSPSPGVIYPTLTWLEDVGFAVAETAEAGRRRYRITEEGKAYLTANHAAVDELFARLGQVGEHAPEGVPAPVVRGMENLKLALRLRLRQGPIDTKAAQAIATALDAATQAVERS
jgi:DNA-binding PadR family transcriptional regulator